MASRSYYDVLGVDPSADSKTIRQAYLQLSLKHHPDKNPTNTEEAKAKFVEIGQAYETLSDDQRRGQYDAALRSARGRIFSPPTQSYESYRDVFDETVAGLSEEELAAALGVISIVGSLIGSVVGSRLGNNSTGGRWLSTAGSLVGSALTSRMASEAFVSLHQESIARVAYRRECQRCVEQGMPMPEPPPVSKWQRALEKTVASVKDQVSRGSQTATSRQWF
ncbi:DnaJ homolog subfamily B member 9 [Fistulifera solaris]|uniref:DnaJ homolog subfamily B member 9 n=1 Tax=Fistulifera solaris TaxID=1519565 RepID=A0A1Z5KEZ3_FISSO|nr:DnaJ homolog subfamily B member 9 [Fistulifera solaris]|eukprot:GAX24890.1 DnaJ homolog subfamily B member 9 [Fistulifera solaris]